MFDYTFNELKSLDSLGFWTDNCGLDLKQLIGDIDGKFSLDLQHY